MGKNGLKQHWLDFILSFSSFIYRRKSSLIYFGILKTLFTVVFILILEIILSIISLPFYFFVVLDEDNLDFKGGVKAFRLRRKITLAILAAFLLFQVLGTILAMIGFGFFYNYLIYGWFF